MMTRATLFFGIVLVAGNTYGADGGSPPPFHAVCEDHSGKAYRNNTALDAEWSAQEEFPGLWKFEYDGGDSVKVDGEPNLILLRDDSQLIVLSNGQNSYALTLWAYAINLEMRTVVASQVNTYTDGPFGNSGVKARSVSFACDFSVKPANRDKAKRQ